MSVDHHMPVRRLLTVFYTGKDGVNPRKILIFRQKLGGVNSASGEKLHAFKIICPARWGAIATPQPLCVRACFTSTIRRKSPDTCIKPMSAFVIFIKHQFLIPPPLYQCNSVACCFKTIIFLLYIGLYISSDVHDDVKIIKFWALLILF